MKRGIDEMVIPSPNMESLDVLAETIRAGTLTEEQAEQLTVLLQWLDSALMLAAQTAPYPGRLLGVRLMGAGCWQWVAEEYRRLLDMRVWP